MLLNKILELTKEGYSVKIEPFMFGDGITIILYKFAGNGMIREHKIISGHWLKQLDENEIVHILEEMKSNIERKLKEHDQT